MIVDGLYVDKEKASEWAAKFDLNQMSETQFDEIVTAWRRFDISNGPRIQDLEDSDSDYKELRECLVSAWKSVGFKEITRYSAYAFDLEVGLALYGYLLDKEFNQIYAETDDWWRFVSIHLCPDLTYMRYPAEGEKRINKKRFYDHPRRIWLKTLWWYVHLCWQGSIEATRVVLEKLGTDAISQIVERPGRGYRTDVSRVIAAKCAEESSWCGAKPFQKVMAQHSVFAASFEPTLFAGGVEGYTNRIFSETQKWLDK